MKLNPDSLEELYSSLRNITGDDVELFEDKISKFSTNVNTDEAVNKEIKDTFLGLSNELSWGLLDVVQSVPNINFLDDINNEKSDYDYKQFLNVPSVLNRTSYRFKRKGIDGKINSYKEEVNLAELENANASNSLSLKRSINTHGNLVRGSTAQLPFTPGGLVMDEMEKVDTEVSALSNSVKLLHKDADGLFDVPQGFQRGIICSENNSNTEENLFTNFKKIDMIDNEVVNRKELEEKQQKIDDEINEKTELEVYRKPTELANTDIDDILPMGIAFGRIKNRNNNLLQKKEWAHVIDLNHRLDNFSELVPNPARIWPFELDVFQKEAIYHLEQGDSVFVAAHTSAGKTVVAEYAIAMSKRNMTKTIYTSPIKALSNQKFRDFKETFDDVEIGLITGDVQINPDANCLIMTTEILRSMLYRGADLIRDVEFVIFDEVHYVNDQDRGVVWEEVIIMLPQHVKFILLSATVPNTYEFANWIGRTKQKNIYVISTPKRPVPLEISIWTKNVLVPVINPKREFLESNFKKHKNLIEGTTSDKVQKTLSHSKENSTRGGARGGARGVSRGGTRGSMRGGSRGAGAIGSNKSQFFKRSGPNKKTWSGIIDYLRGKDLLPAVIFVFSKKRCEEYADWLDAVSFCSNKEKSQIHMFIEKSITRLKKEDRELPQILKIRSLLERGIAVHHGGLLPIVKELIEILFSKGLIKVLFATETFAMGLNLPTRTVIFSELQKHDVNGLRSLTPGEFTQMAGRAGRRGLDKIGTVIVMAYTEPLNQSVFKEVTLGIPTKLQSQFKLTYNMILNLLRIEAFKVEEMIKYSFGENLKQTLQPEHEKQIKQLTSELQDIKQSSCNTCAEDIDKFLDLSISLKTVTSNLFEELGKSEKSYTVFRVGRLIVYRDGDDNAKLGFLYRTSKDNGVVVLTFTNPQTSPDGSANHLPYLEGNKEFNSSHIGRFTYSPYILENIAFSQIELVTKYILRISFTDIFNEEKEALELLDNEIRTILRISTKLMISSNQSSGSVKVHQLLLEQSNITKQILTCKCIKCANFASHYKPKYDKYLIDSKIKNLYHLMSNQNLTLLPEYENRLKVLHRTGFIDQNQNVTLKGRVACEINTGFELVITELILDNFLGDFEPEEIVSLLSAFIYEGRSRDEPPPIVTPRLIKGKQKIEEIYGRMLDIFAEEQITMTKEESEFLEMKRFGLINVIYEWARGLSFKEIMEISIEQEGTVVRVITRLDEICRQVKTAAIIIGNSGLHSKMSQAQELIKRDIVFAASLYL
ncbi:hypothetical protein TPHA_0B02170 [Tetrapisispora phaffii CBS 4417]|uniref:Antiviral helicase SKI2 n=1 Tax=Tetrapisispora phaffii (strain ATCC 24235 / CBS 4417 / NBRC 1672 / NRRL Y-8282 / UCD 70-5) TaxID=1071381 RepID=G8BPF8_TETPH|nr:hypothetical protein TPHA_0B02170 [Tetrapisispora phaffii CBS 4417]CCE61889.1 hypothetical protein TPHA_0B02170 [Tetrapisispora phaffii CBS 4417]